MARRRKPRKMYKGRGGWLLRTTPCTPSEKRRRAHSITIRIGQDLVEWIRETAKNFELTQGELARALLLDAAERWESGQIDPPESWWYGSQNGKKYGSDALGRRTSEHPGGIDTPD